MINLRDYQEKLLDDIKDVIKSGIRRVLAVAGCGAGKTVCFCSIAHSASQRGRSVLIVLHRKELLGQASKTLRRNGIHHGLIGAGYTPDPIALINIAMVQSANTRLSYIRKPDIIIIDETHRVCSASYTRLLAAFPDAIVLGFTASPIRTDGRPLGSVFQKMVFGPSNTWLTENGYLSPIRYWVPPCHVDLRGVKKKGGDYDPDDLEKRTNNATITGDAIATYRRIADGKKCAVFCCNIAHAESVAVEYNTAGIPARAMHGGLASDVRDRITKQLENGEIQVVTSAQLIIEGWDLPSLEVCQILRPTSSINIHIQMLGRVSRVHDAKDYGVVIDHVGNIARHGLAETPREWSLDGIEKKKKAVTESLGLKQCHKCFALVKPAPICSECGNNFPIPKPKQLTYIEGHLEEIKTLPLSKALKECKTRDDLKLLARVKGYKPGFVYYKAKEMNLR